LLLNVGTGGQLTAYSGKYVSVEGLETRPFPDGGFLLVGASLAGGNSYAMLEGLFRSIVEAFAGRDQPVPPLYDKMDELLGLEWPSSNKLTVHSQFFGTRRRPEQRGIIEGIGPANLTPQHLIAGFLEGMTDELYGFYSQLPEVVRGGFLTLTGSGNGVRSNRHLRRICAERFAMPMLLPVFREEASVGAALHAAVALGAVDGYAACGRLLPAARKC
jgi:sedoheptulokinase